MSTDLRTIQKNGAMVRFKKDWRHKSRVVGQMDDDQMATALTVYAQCGRKATAAMAAGVTVVTLRNYQDSDPDFAVAMEEALDIYRDTITEVVENRALNGVDEPIIGGKNKDEIVAYVKRFETALTIMHAKRYIPEYSEKHQLEISGQIDHGVLVVGATGARRSSKDGKTWEEMYAGHIPPGSLELPMAPAVAGVEVEPTPFEKDPKPLGWDELNARKNAERKRGREAEGKQ